MKRRSGAPMGLTLWLMGLGGLIWGGSYLDKVQALSLQPLALAVLGVSLLCLVAGCLLVADHWPARAAGAAALAACWIGASWQSSDMPEASKGTVVVAASAIVGLWGLFALLSGSMKKAGSYWILSLLAAFLMAPFAWMVIISLHPSKSPIPKLAEILPVSQREVRDSDGKPVLIRERSHGTGQMAMVAKKEAHLDPHFENYAFVLFHPNLPVSRFFFNSFFVTLSVVLGQLLVASMAAYGFARLKFKGSAWVFGLFLGSMMFAGPVTQIPVYLFFKSLGWLDTYWVLIVPGVSSAFTIFLLRQFFLQIPRELDEAARMDGASELLIYWRVILPLSRAALATAAAFTFIGVWTDFFNPLIYTNSTEMRTLEVGLSIFKNSYGGSNWPLQMTAAVIVMLPLLVVFLLTQRYFVKGITLGSIK